MLNFGVNLWCYPKIKVTQCITASRHRAMHKAGCWVLSTGDSCRSTVGNIWQRSMCLCEINFSSEAGEKLQRKLHLFLEIFQFHICLINILQLHGACP